MTGGGKCSLFPSCLSSRTSEEFRQPRLLNGLKIYFRDTKAAFPHQTPLLRLGRALLTYAIEKLGMSDLRNWRNAESGDPVDDMLQLLGVGTSPDKA